MRYPPRLGLDVGGTRARCALSAYLQAVHVLHGSAAQQAGHMGLVLRGGHRRLALGEGAVRGRMRGEGGGECGVG